LTFRTAPLAPVSIALFFLLSLPGNAGGQRLAAPAGLPLSAGQSALADRALLREKEVIRTVRERSPIIETYIQSLGGRVNGSPILDADQHFLGRVDFGRVIGDTPFEAGNRPGHPKTGFGKGSSTFLKNVVGSLRLEFAEAGFVRLALVDSTGDFDRQHYNFSFIQNELLGSVPTVVFAVEPVTRSAGRFVGRIWVETNGGNIVRYQGDVEGTQKGVREYLPFESWRTNVQPNLWLPASVYIEKKNSAGAVELRASCQIWGYALKVATAAAENTSIQVSEATDISNESPDISPLAAQHAFVAQAEANVIDRLFQAGLLDAPGEFDKGMEAIANNILAFNNIALSSPIHVRTLLTEPLESLAIGNTIILSKSLIDTSAVVSSDGKLQNGNLTTLIAFQLAHILAGHRLNTKFAFNDELHFADSLLFRRMPMHHSDAENIDAARRAIELVSAPAMVSAVGDSTQYFGLYLQALQQRSGSLHALNQPMIGDGLVKSDADPTPWLAALLSRSGKLSGSGVNDAALPLSGFLSTDPWTDQVLAPRAGSPPLQTVADALPFAVSPVVPRLAYFKPYDYQEPPPPAPVQHP
jgi:hypothetical protein